MDLEKALDQTTRILSRTEIKALRALPARVNKGELVTSYLAVADFRKPLPDQVIYKPIGLTTFGEGREERTEMGYQQVARIPFGEVWDTDLG